MNRVHANFVGHVLRHAAAMPRYEMPTEGTLATTAAHANFARNVAALERVWPRTVLALPERPPELEWLYARDGALSARHVDRRWFNDVSVPRRAAERTLAKLAVNGTTAVLLAPTHAAQVRRALDKLAPAQTLIAVIPGEANAGVIAACDDFADAIQARRLWLAVGPAWEVELKAILDGNDGIAPATTMIRVRGLNAAVVDLIQRPCEALLARHAQQHKELIAAIVAKRRPPRSTNPRLCVAGGPFALWDDAGPLLREAALASEYDVVDHDLALASNASSLRFARAAEGCDAVVATQAGRTDLPGLVDDDVPWVTWATRGRVPAFASRQDLLVIADAAVHAAALAAGWPASRVIVGGEPIGRIEPRAGARPMLLADLPPVVMPACVVEMSSHRIVWELVERELTERPFARRPALDAYLYECAERVGVPQASFPIELFREALVLPLIARESARALVAAGVDVTIRGRGWQHVPDVADRLRGEITSPDEWRDAIADSGVLLDVWPGTAAHRARRCGRPFVEVWGRTLDDVRQALASRPTTTTRAVQSFDVAAVMRHLDVAARLAA